MKVAIVTETFLPATDGIVTRLLYAIDALVAQGNEVLIVCPDMGEEVHVEGATVVTTPSKTFSFYPSRPWGLPSSKVTDALEDFGPEIIHTVSPTSLCLTATKYAEDNGIPLISSYHTRMIQYFDHYWYFKPFKGIIWSYLRALLNAAPRTLVTSGAMQKELTAAGVVGVDVLPRGLDQEKRHPKHASAEMRARLTEGEVDKPLLVYIGRLAIEKDIESLLAVVKANPDYRYAIIGDGPIKKELEEIFADTPTIFTGFLHGDEVSQAFATADVFLFPSRSETLGMVILEAMASGTPIISVRSEPIEEQIDNGINGIIYDTEEELLAAVHTLLNDKELYETIRRNGLESASSQSWENASQALIDFYVETIELYESVDFDQKKIKEMIKNRT